MVVLDGFLAAWHQGDSEAALGICHPEIEIVEIAELVPGHGTAFSGREGAQRWMELLAELWDVEFRCETGERRVLDEHSVELLSEIEARSSGEHGDFMVSRRSLWKVSDGMLRRVEASVARETARDARQA